MSKRYLTTTLPYVNADPHIGFALEIIQADALARFWRARGDEVFFNTGTDEHGQKIADAAKKAGQDVKAYVDHYAARFQELKEILNLSNDKFIRTTDQTHLDAAAEMWKRCEAAGDIYKKSYEGLYCVGCEKFLTPREIVDGKCAIHQRELEKIKEENYFFRFSKYQEALTKYLSEPGRIIPDWRREEALNFIKEGLQDFSISRERERLEWGVPVPGEEESSLPAGRQVMYVWFDALTSYISTLNWPQKGEFEKFWVEGETRQLAGKDQVRFQSLMWQAMLMSANLKNTDQIIYHGFINSGGQKMSKSLGNVINPLGVVKEYGTDALRYYLLRHIHPFEDSDFTLEKFKEIYNAHLANGLGNLVSRVMKLSETYCEPMGENCDRERVEEIEQAMASYNYNLALDYIWTKIGAADAYVQSTEPFKTIKTDPEKAKSDIRYLVNELATIAYLLQPFLPTTSAKILAAIKANHLAEPLFMRK